MAGTDYFTVENSEAAVIARLKDCDNPRLKEVTTSLVKHMHACIKEIEPTFDEWLMAINFLTAVGKIATDRRQEFILLSDILGISMLVDSVEHMVEHGSTETTVLGPFHVTGAPHRKMGDDINLDGKGLPLYMEGYVRNDKGEPIEGATLDLWHSNEDGFYDVQQPGIQTEFNLRGIFTTGKDGKYWFRSARPQYYPIPNDGPVGHLLKAQGRHPYRPSHIHFIVKAPGYESLTTHVFRRGDPYLESDAVFGVKESLIIDFPEFDDPKKAAELGIGNPFCTTTYDFVLTRE